MIRAITTPTKITPTERKIYLEIDNGDFQVLNQVKDKWSFTDFEFLLRFALVVLLSASNNNIYIDEGSKKVKIKPAEGISQDSTIIS